MASVFIGVHWRPNSQIPSASRLLYIVEPVIAAIVLICLSPFLVILALAIRAASGNAPLIAHRRVGRYGQTLWVYKFRTMWPAPSHKSSFFVEKMVAEKPYPKMALDSRVTSRFASFSPAALYRRASAIIPGRDWPHVDRRSPPITRFELSEYYDSDAMEVLSVKPGLTGLWQVRGRSRLTYRQRKRLDLFLVRRFSIGLYLRIVALTVPDLLFGRNAW